MTWNTVERKNVPVEGRHRYLSVALLSTEAVIAYKYRYGTGNLVFAPTPLYVWLPWAITGASCFMFWVYLRFKPNRTRKYIEKPKVMVKETGSPAKPRSSNTGA